jgi:predicted dehydrogenase
MVKIVLAGIGGMGWVYLEELWKDLSLGRYRLEGVVDPDPERCPQLAKLRELRTPIYSDLPSFYDRHTADLAVISSPIQFHTRQTVCALEHDSDVLVEKPVAAVIQDVRTMAEAERRSGRRVSVGFQWSFSSAIQDLKTDILSGRFGAARRLRCLYLWPRDFAYYGRNDWAGKQKSAAGDWILDSPANNAMAHDLHNMLYLLGPTVSESARPVRVQAELYRTYPIENFDTAAARFETAAGVEILFWVSHASAGDPGPVISFEFEHGRVFGSGRGTALRARFDDGTERIYGVPDAEPLRKLRLAIDGRESGLAPLCGIAAASSQILALNGMQESSPRIRNFPSGLVGEIAAPSGRRLVVSGLDDALGACYEAGRLPSEMGISWAAPGDLVELSNDRSYPRP